MASDYDKAAKAEARRITDMGWELLLEKPDMTLLEFMHKLECRNWSKNV